MTKDSSSSSSGSGSGSGAGAGTSSGGPEYTVTNRGTNDQGNHWDARDYGMSGSNPNTYHYSNTDGSYYYSNPNGSTYYNDGQGGARYTPPGK